jgi:16S rRNA C967 or C1407 C5-methylase (RsmB/RsmF family)
MRSWIARWQESRKREAGRRRAQRLQADLEQRGVPAALARAVSDRLESKAVALDRAAYQAVVDATCTTWGARRKTAPPDAALEIQRLVQDFAVELQKLDEGLRLLSTYLLRIRDRARSDDSARLVH